MSQSIRFSYFVPTTSGITNFAVFATTGTFPTGLPTNGLVMLGNSTTFQGSFTPPTTGLYTVRVYSYNADSKAYSTSCVSGQVLIEGINPIQSIQIASLQLQSYTGSYGTNNFGKKSISSIDSNPYFQWQAGQGGESTNYSYRFTIRPRTLTPYPSNTILYQNSGIISNASGLGVSFPFSTNLTTVGGPYRSFDAVVEALHSSGDSSVGYNVYDGSTPRWGQFPNGYDALEVVNNSPSGIDLTSGTVNSGGYASYAWVDSNWGVNVLFTGGSFLNDIVGGYTYTTNTTGNVFTKNDIATGSDTYLASKGIKRTEFSFDTNYKYIYAPMGVIPKRGGFGGGSLAISFYDVFDKADRDNGHTRFFTGSYVSNVINVSGEAFGTVFNASDGFAIFSPTGGSQQSMLKLIPFGTGYMTVMRDANGNDTVIGYY